MSWRKKAMQVCTRGRMREIKIEGEVFGGEMRQRLVTVG